MFFFCFWFNLFTKFLIFHQFAYVLTIQDGSSLKLPRQAIEENESVFIERLIRLARITFESLSHQESTELKLAAQLYDACIEVKDYFKSSHNIHE